MLLFTLFLTPARGFAGEPTTQLSTTINEFVNILVHTPVAELRAMGLPARALDLVFGRFDFSEMTKRSLGRHWGALAPAEQREFVKAFTQKLLVAYGRTVRASGDERIQFQNEIIVGNDAMVKTKVVSSGDELAIDYHLHAIDGQWKVYDMVIDHVSIVNNYRAQFDRVIAKSSVEELLQKMQQQDS
ncbi:MAG: MlaC/ttg2D family ABC transporter substrate-binding protein [Candidatus Binatia bacterium]